MDIWNKIKGMTSPFSGTDKKSWPSPTWSQVREKRMNNAESGDSEDCNGFVLSDVTIPEVALEVLLSWVPVDRILSVAKVCRVWKDVTTRRSFWKLVCQKNGLKWDSIPEHLKEKDNGWIVMYAAARHHIFQRNFVQNGCGEDGFAHWKKIRNRGHGLVVEKPPVGIPPLPDDPLYPVDSAFVTSFEWCSLYQKISLWEVGLTPAVLAAMLPCKIVCSLVVGVRFDCGGLYRITLTLEDDKGNAELSTERQGELEAGQEWSPMQLPLLMTDEVGTRDKLRSKSIRYLVIRIDGKDARWWAGHYGAKFSRISIRLNCLSPSSPEAEVSPGCNQVESRSFARPETEDEFSELDEIHSDFSSNSDSIDDESSSDSDSDEYKEVVSDSEVEDEEMSESEDAENDEIMAGSTESDGD